MKTKLNIIKIAFVVLLFFSSTESYAQARTSQYDVYPLDLTSTATKEFDHISSKKLDTTGGIYTCLKTNRWDYGVPILNGICTYNLLSIPPEITPSNEQLNDFRGADVLNPCAALGSKYVNRYWKHGYGAYGEEGDVGFCKKLKDMAFLTPEYLNQEKSTFFALLNSIVPDAMAQSLNSSVPKMSGTCYDKFLDLKRSPARLNAKKAEEIDTCMAFCELSPPTVKAQNFCGINKCLADYNSNNKPTDWCCSLSEKMQGKFGINNPLYNIRQRCGVGLTLPVCLQKFSATGDVSQNCCKYSKEIAKYHKRAGVELTRMCGAYNSAKYCMASFNKDAKKLDDSCCVLNYSYSGKIKHSPLIGDLPAGKFLDVKKAVKNQCAGFKITEDENVKKCVLNLKRTRKLSAECCIAYHTGRLNPSTIGANFTRIEKYCYPEKYRK